MFITKCTGGWILSARFWIKATAAVPLHFVWIWLQVSPDNGLVLTAIFLNSAEVMQLTTAHISYLRSYLLSSSSVRAGTEADRNA